MPNSSRNLLVDFLSETHRADEQRRLVRLLPQGEQMALDLREEGSIRMQAHELVDLSGRCGVMSELAQVALASGRGTAAAREALAAAWGLSLTPASPTSTGAAPPARPATTSTPAGASTPAPSAGARPVRILHLSDLHLQASTAWDFGPLLDRVPDVVSDLVENGEGPDLIALTGDIAMRGAKADYELATTFLRDKLLPAAKLGPEALLVVPGNHDVDRGAASSFMLKKVEEGLRGGTEADVAQVFQDAAQRGLLWARYEAFRAFLKELGVKHPTDPTWSHRLEVHGVALHIAGLDTAWLHTGDGLQGRLVLGLAPLNAALQGRRPTDLVLALAHHPLDWLAEWDQRAVRPALRAQVDVFLRGHLHEPDWSWASTPGSSMVELPAGSLYADSQYANSFQLVELNPAAGQGRARAWVWHKGRYAWVLDRNHADAVDGVWTFPLRRR